MNKMKIIVAHPGRQHSFRVAKALKESGMLFKYATTVYNKDDSILMRCLKLFLSKDNLNRAKKRKCPSLSDNDVIQFCEIEGFILLALQRLDRSHRIDRWFMRYIAKRFQRKLAKYIVDNKVDAVISYDTNSTILFDILERKAPNVVKIMDNAHPNRHYLNKSYNDNWNAVGNFGSTLEACRYITNAKVSETFGDEAKKADYHIVASSYSTEALTFEGIPENRIFKVPYGVDENKFVGGNKEYSTECLNVLFIGEVNQRKGINQILQVAKHMHNSGFNFKIVGGGYETAPVEYSKYKDFVDFMGRVSFETLLEQLKTNHVFLFPTMGEGFGLVLLEAMAAGLPVITTPNCAGYDIVKDGVNGFVVPVGDEEAIREKLLWMKNQPEELKIMSENAVETAKKFTWERYEADLVSAVRQMVESHK